MISTIYLLYLLATSTIFRDISEILHFFLDDRVQTPLLCAVRTTARKESTLASTRWQGKVLEFQGSERGAFHVPRVFKTVIDVSESEVVERVASVILHSIFLIRHCSFHPCRPSKNGTKHGEKITATRAQHSHHEETRSINCMETRKPE
jgi:hypothetical protein